MHTRSFFLYVPSDSPLHRMHPLVKFLILIVINVFALTVDSPIMLTMAIILTLIGFKVARIPLKKMSRFLILIFLVMQGITVSYLLASRIPGRTVLYETPWGTYATEMTILYAFTMVLRFFTMLIGSTLILASTNDRDIVYALRSLRLPYAASFTVTLAFRTMSIFLDDYFKVRDAMVLRGTDFSKGSIIERVKKYVYLGVPLALIAVRRIIEVTQAIEIKGFKLGGKRTYYHELEFRRVDLVISILTLLVLILIFFFKYYLQCPLLSFPGI